MFQPRANLEQMPGWGFAYVQDEVNLHNLHVLKGTFSLDTAHMKITITYQPDLHKGYNHKICWYKSNQDHTSKYIALNKVFLSNKNILSFLFLHENKCCENSLEAPRQGASYEHPQHIFYVQKWENTTFFAEKKSLIHAMWISYTLTQCMCDFQFYTSLLAQFCACLSTWTYIYNYKSTKMHDKSKWKMVKHKYKTEKSVSQMPNHKCVYVPDYKWL